MATLRRGNLTILAGAVAVAVSLYLPKNANSVQAEGNYQELTMNVGDQSRSYVLIRPSASGPLPTVIFLHGKGGSANRLRWTGFGEVGPRDGFVTVLPNGRGGQWNVFPPGVRDLLPGMARRGGIGTDTAFIKQLVADLISRNIADPKRIYVGGVSNGGIMAFRMACDSPQLFAAIGVISASMPDYGGQDCHPPKPLPLLMINGTEDDIVPYSGGSTAGGLQVWGADRTIAFFRKLNGCNGAGKRSQMQRAGGVTGPPIVVDRWSACSGAPVVIYSIVGGGHEAGGGGGIDGRFTAAQTLWDFFSDKTANTN